MIAAAIAGAAVAAGAALVVPAVAHPAGRAVVAIGDSIMDGHGLDDGQSWPEVVARTHGWALTDLAADGDGFVTPGNDGTTFADQVTTAIRLRPSMVILSGSSNDLGKDETQVESAIAAAVQRLRAALPDATIVAASPVWREDAFPAQLTRIAAVVAKDVRAAGGTVLSFADPLRGHPELMQSDDVHPTAAGQLAIAALVEQRLEAEDLV